MPLGLSLDPKTILSDFGPFIVFLIVFAETGLLIGFFLPGDSLLFTAGVLTASDDLDIHIALLATGCFVAAVAGDQLGYVIGKKLGPSLFRRPDSRLFKQEYVQRTKDYFEQRGPRTIVIARFVPVVRTFAPVLAGVGEMDHRTFSVFNVLGGLLWAVGITFLGFALGDVIGDSIDTYIYPLVAVIVILSSIPPWLEWRRARRARVKPATESEATAEAAELHALLDDDSER